MYLGYRSARLICAITVVAAFSWAFDIELPGGARVCDTCGGGIIGGSRPPIISPPGSIQPPTIQQCLQNLGSCPQAVIDEHRNDIELAQTCVQDISKCPENVLKVIPARALRPIIDAYIADLRNQADGKWTTIPDWVSKQFGDQYPDVDMSSVRIATGINTRHGQAITIGDQIFFPSSLDLSQHEDLKWLLHELEHVGQYRRKGSIDAFISEYLLQVSGTVIAHESFNVHDDVSVEQAAIAKSESLIAKYGWQFEVKNDCKYFVMASVYYLDPDTQTWTKKSWYKINAHNALMLDDDNGGHIHSQNHIWLYYAKVLGTPIEWDGTYSITADDGAVLKYRQIETSVAELDSLGKYSVTLTCPNAN